MIDPVIFRAVFFDAADAMLILDDSRVIVEANTAACALFGRHHAAIVKHQLDALVAGGTEPLQTAWREVIALGEGKHEHHVESPSGGMRIVECSYRARVDDGLHLCIARDISHRRMLEARVAQSAKDESVGRLAGGIAHDFNNLLTAILGYAELLLSDRDADDPERHDLEEIQKAALRAAALTHQLLSFSRKQVLIPKDVDLNQTVSNLQAMLGRLIREDIRITTVLPASPAIVRLDPTQIEQLIVNLVLNARDALPDGGDIRIEVAKVRRNSQDLSAELPRGTAEYVRLSVTDNGVGFTAEARAHLFEPFYTTPEVGKGSGLGLASAYGFVRQSHGFMNVESEPGAGAAFIMHFPAVLTNAADEAKSLTAGELAPDHDTILLVEDEDAVRLIVGAVLRRSGYRVLEASTPRGACEMFDRHSRDIDLLVTDIVMPDMNGPALAQRLVGRRPDLRVLFISGYSDRSTPIDAENPNVSFLSKPFQASVLSARVKNMLDGPESRTSRVTSGA